MSPSRSPAPEGGSGIPDAAGAAVFFTGEWIPELPAKLPASLLALVPSRTAHALGVVPWEERGAELIVVCVDPLRPDLAGDLGFVLGRPVGLAGGEPARVRRLLEASYPIGHDTGGAAGPGGNLSGAAGPGGNLSGAAGPGGHAEAAPARGRPDAAELAAQAGAGPVVEFVARVLHGAVSAKAADVHFEARPDGLQVRCRVDGTLRETDSGPPSLALAVASRLKVLAGLDVAERRRPQDGRLRWPSGGRVVDLRVATLPTQDGESVVLRVLDPANAARGLDALGLPGAVREGLACALAQPGGLVVVTGPTGSGKTTTLYGCLRKLNTAETKVLTVEDPVEYELEGLTQIAVQPAIGLTFAAALRAFLRHDPDVVMVGEVRDAETAEIAVQAALTGHLVLATLHTVDAAGAVARLMDLGVEPYRVAAALQGVLAQRLIRKLCPECRVREAGRPREIESWLVGDESAAGSGAGECFSARGCGACGGSGFRGRQGIFEWLAIDDALREAIGAARPIAAWPGAEARRRNESLRAAGVAAVRQGWTSWDEILRHT